MITVAYLDLDSVAYVGASIAAKLNYVWVHKDGIQKSEVFKKAEDAKVWYEGKVDFEEIIPEEWTRETIVREEPVEFAIKGVENELNSWIRTARKLSGNKDIILKSYLTSSGLKNKDIKGLEDRYQFNRYDVKAEDYEGWVPKPKPKHLKACREYLLNTYDWTKLSAKGIEADAPVIYFSERKGKSALMMSKDKDLKQVMNTYYVDMNLAEKHRELKLSTELGYIELVEDRKGVKSGKGDGFKLLCFQLCVGDTSDGYKGLKGFGPVSGFELLDPCKTVEECCEAIVNLYKDKFPDGHEYKSWDGVITKRTWQELLIQHCQLAYHERGPKDKSNPMERYINGEDPIFRYN